MFPGDLWQNLEIDISVFFFFELLKKIFVKKGNASGKLSPVEIFRRMIEYGMKMENVNGMAII